MTAFYTYIAFSQYLLIWYANIPEETIWYRHRLHGNWICRWALAMPFIRFIIPFFTLLCRPAKRSLKVMAAMAVWSLVVEYDRPVLDRDADVITRTGPQPHWLDLATLVATVSMCGLAFWAGSSAQDGAGGRPAVRTVAAFRERVGESR
jgi:hypothetical protein